MNSFSSRAVKFLAGVAIFAGLPVIAWGVTDLTGFFAHPARLGYVIAVVVMQLVIAIRFPDLGSSRGARSTTSVGTPREQRLFLMLQVIPLAILMLAPYSARRGLTLMGNDEFLPYLGLFLFVAGFILMFWAEAALGSQFNVAVTLQEHHRLITDGLYSYLQHPRYLGIITYNLGISLLFTSWIGVLLTVVLAVVLILRIQDEEAMLRREFGAMWEEYAARTKRLIPYIY